MSALMNALREEGTKEDCLTALERARDRIAALEALLAQADAVVGRNFPCAGPGIVQADTLACVERHRARQRMGTMFVGNTDAALADLRAAMWSVETLTTLDQQPGIVAFTRTNAEAKALCDALSAIVEG